MGFSIHPTTRLNHSSRPETSTSKTRTVNSMDPKILRKETITSALITDVWTVWTTNEGVTSFLAPKANIKLEDNGPYEILFDPEAPLGSRGTEGCKIPGLEELQTLSEEWQRPPQYPNDRRHKPGVDIYFERVEDLT